MSGALEPFLEFLGSVIRASGCTVTLFYSRSQNSTVDNSDAFPSPVKLFEICSG